MSIFQFKASKDNYNWILICDETKECAGIDILDSKIFFDYLEKNHLKLIAILNTHHHQDHCGANTKIKAKYPNIDFYASLYDFEKDRIPEQNKILIENATLKIGNVQVNVLETPGHTLGHLVYYGKDFAFVGDTLFVSGCGRLFEGTAKQMFNSLKKILNNIKPNANIYCGHEYTLSNLKFSSIFNEEYFEEYKKIVEEKVNRNIPTVPTSLAKELNYNPFLMILDESLKNNILKLENYLPEDAFAYLRSKKDSF